MAKPYRSAPQPPKNIVNFFGRYVLPFTNPRVVAPPGRPGQHGRPNIFIATPMRSGTHVLIDLILNNIPAYRTRPLYINLDQCRKQSAPGRDLVGSIDLAAGHVIKTHLPCGVDEAMLTDAAVLQLLEAGIVVTVMRSREEVVRSLARWHKAISAQEIRYYEEQYDTFWEFWAPRKRVHLDFRQLFEPAPMQRLLAELAEATGTSVAPVFIGPPATRPLGRIHVNKALTRLLGRHAPRIDTTIHTLKA